MERVTVWAEPINQPSEPYFVSIANTRTLRAYPEYLAFLVEKLIGKIVDEIGSTPCILQARTEYWTLLANGGYDYRMDWDDEK